MVGVEAGGLKRTRQAKARWWLRHERGDSDQVLQEVLDLDKKLAGVDSELFEANEELRRFEAVKAKLEVRSFSDTSRVGLDRRTVSRGQRSEGEVGLAEWDFGVGLDWGTSEGSHGFVSSAGGSQKKRKDVARKRVG